MALNLSMGAEQDDLKPRITVFGVGGAGGNAVNNMIAQQLEGVEFVVANADAQALQQSNAAARIQMGLRVTEGLGAGARPSVGAAAAEETIEEIVDHLAGAHMCFITAGMGGGTGTGAAPIVANAARDLGALTVGVVTRPFDFEGRQRANNASAGIKELRQAVDTLIVIPNDRLLEIAEKELSVLEAYHMADEVLRSGVKGISDLITIPGLVNLDFADVKAVMKDAGTAIMGIGSASGEDRAMRATENAISSPLLEARIDGAHGVLLSFQAGADFSMQELARASQLVKESVDPNANIIVGQIIEDSLGDVVNVTVIAAGFDETDDHIVHGRVPQQVPASVPASPAQAPVQPVQAADQTEPGHLVSPSAPVAPQQPVADEKSRSDLDIPSFLFNED